MAYFLFELLNIKYVFYMKIKSKKINVAFNNVKLYNFFYTN